MVTKSLSLLANEPKKLQELDERGLKGDVVVLLDISTLLPQDLRPQLLVDTLEEPRPFGLEVKVRSEGSALFASMLAL